MIQYFKLFVLLKRSRQETSVFKTFKETLFPIGWLQKFESWLVLGNLCRLSKKCNFTAFLKIMEKSYKFGLKK